VHINYKPSCLHYSALLCFCANFMSNTRFNRTSQCCSYSRQAIFFFSDIQRTETTYMVVACSQLQQSALARHSPVHPALSLTSTLSVFLSAYSTTVGASCGHCPTNSFVPGWTISNSLLNCSHITNIQLYNFWTVCVCFSVASFGGLRPLLVTSHC